MPRGRIRSRQLRVTMFMLVRSSRSRVYAAIPVVPSNPLSGSTRRLPVCFSKFFALVPAPHPLPPVEGAGGGLTRVVLDDELLANRGLVHLVAHRRRLQDGEEVVLVELEPRQLRALLDLRERRDHFLDGAALLADL